MAEVSSVTAAGVAVMAHLTATGNVVGRAQADMQDKVLKVFHLAELMHRQAAAAPQVGTTQVPMVYQPAAV
jgi:hypothetical protein